MLIACVRIGYLGAYGQWASAICPILCCFAPVFGSPQASICHMTAIQSPSHQPRRLVRRLIPRRCSERAFRLIERQWHGASTIVASKTVLYDHTKPMSPTKTSHPAGVATRPTAPSMSPVHRGYQESGWGYLSFSGHPQHRSDGTTTANFGLKTAAR